MNLVLTCDWCGDPAEYQIIDPIGRGTTGHACRAHVTLSVNLILSYGWRWTVIAPFADGSTLPIPPTSADGSPPVGSRNVLDDPDLFAEVQAAADTDPTDHF